MHAIKSKHTAARYRSDLRLRPGITQLTPTQVKALDIAALRKDPLLSAVDADGNTIPWPGSECPVAADLKLVDPPAKKPTTQKPKKA